MSARRQTRSAARRGAKNSGESPEWRYAQVRRLAIFIEDSVYRATQWAVFEPNNEALWSRLQSSVEGFMQELFQQGKFKGKDTRQAYFVKCGPETTAQADIDRGVVNIVIGYTPSKGAEFVVLRVQQGAGRQAPRHRQGMSEKGRIRAAIGHLEEAKDELAKASESDDIGLEMVELLAFVGDQLSTYQDAIADEANLETSRGRVSRIRR